MLRTHTYIVGRYAFDVCAGGEEAAFTGQDGEDCIGMCVQEAEGSDGRWDDGAAKSIQGFGPVELVFGLAEL